MTKKFFIIPIALFAITTAFKSGEPELAVQSSVQTSDTLNAAEIQLVPSVMDIAETSEKFLIREIKVLNKGGSPLVIKSVTPSCWCASVVVMTPTVNPMTTGKIRLSMNTAGMSDTLNRLEFIVESNAKNSPTAYSVFVRLPKSVLKTSSVE
ncbi:MAG: DUF1573 domain-containing protein [Bacteroidota bacterium]